MFYDLVALMARRGDDFERRLSCRPQIAARLMILRWLAILWATAVFAFVVMAPAVAQEGDLNTILKRFNELYAAGNYDAARDGA
jgi:hypothetical protein